MPATVLGLVTRGSEAGNADSLSTVIINGNFMELFFSFSIIFRKKSAVICFANAAMLKFSAYFL